MPITVTVSTVNTAGTIKPSHNSVVTVGPSTWGPKTTNHRVEAGVAPSSILTSVPVRASSTLTEAMTFGCDISVRGRYDVQLYEHDHPVGLDEGGDGARGLTHRVGAFYD
jgi:hypothetical protein